MHNSSHPSVGLSYIYIHSRWWQHYINYKNTFLSQFQQYFAYSLCLPLDFYLFKILWPFFFLYYYRTFCSTNLSLAHPLFLPPATHFLLSPIPPSINCKIIQALKDQTDRLASWVKKAEKLGTNCTNTIMVGQEGQQILSKKGRNVVPITNCLAFLFSECCI